MSKNNVLIIEDEEHILELLKYNFEENGYDVQLAEDGKTGLNMAKALLPSLILLDLMIPEMDGIEVCKALKQYEPTHDIPVIMLTAKGSETDKVLGLEIGADDYMTKPFSIRELLARAKVVLKRNAKTPKEDVRRYQLDDIVIDVDRHEVYRGNEKFQLTFKEFELLKILVENRGKVLTRDYLLDAVWGYEYYGETRTVDVHIRHLRKKIETDSSRYIETIRGVGYKVK